MTDFRRIRVRDEVELNVAIAGDPSLPAVILLHGFPESHRTWREIAPRLQDRFHVIMPDQLGFGRSDRPQDIEAYEADKLVGDVLALADAMGIETFALVGHDWGGAIAWTAALKHPDRVTRLAIINAPHPLIFQKSLIEDSDQRAASQYIAAFRTPGFEKAIGAMGLEAFFEKTFSGHVDIAMIPEAEKQQYLADWSRPGAMRAMLNWYRASKLIIPPPGITVPLPAWLLRAFPSVDVPTLVIWGMRDKVLLPIQLEGLDRLVEDLRVARIAEAGHFVPWESPDPVAAALAPFLAGGSGASASAA